MEAFAIEKLSFSYPDKLGSNTSSRVLQDVTLHVQKGEFITFCGKSGCGKTTLLRHLKPDLTPHGNRSGVIRFDGRPIEEWDRRSQASRIGFVLQSPDNQIVTDKVWHELAFGLESLGCDSVEIRRRVAEMASFFGIQSWFHKSVSELSGGQKQLLNLAAIMVMQPEVLVLDEPTSQLDPIAASEFLGTLGKVHRDLGLTILLSEHRLEEALPLSDRVVVMDAGSIVAAGTPQEVGLELYAQKHDMFAAMPAPMRLHVAIGEKGVPPVTIREGRQMLQRVAVQKLGQVEQLEQSVGSEERVAKSDGMTLAVELDHIWFKYEKASPDVLKGLSLKIPTGEIHAIVGGNGTGKTTTLSIIAGLLAPYRGKVHLFGKPCLASSGQSGFHGMVGVLPQNPQTLFVRPTVAADLADMLEDSRLSPTEQRSRMQEVVHLCELTDLLERHPYDLSGGEQQRAALAKVLLLDPKLLLLDEPTKGLDAHYKAKLATLLRRLVAQGKTIVLVSHDIEFCASHADSCSMHFDGGIVASDAAKPFFAGNSFYTTAANRMARSLLPDAVTVEDIVEGLALGSKAVSTKAQSVADKSEFEKSAKKKTIVEETTTEQKITEQKITEQKITELSLGDKPSSHLHGLQLRTLVGLAMLLLAIPLTIALGIYYLDDRKYYFISLLVILEAMLPFALLYEGRRPEARELLTIAVLAAIAVASRVAFFMVPQFKPMLAIVIIAGIALGAEAGFLVGAVAAFVSNYFFGQGPWTPWQMFALGSIGFLAGILLHKQKLGRSPLAVSLFGGLTAFFLYGGIMNASGVLLGQAEVSWELLVAAMVRGLPFDFIHAAATILFLLVLSRPMLAKLDRVKQKYGLMTTTSSDKTKASTERTGEEGTN